MGVQGLWDILQVTAQSRSLAHLAVVDGFERNTSGRRALRVGIDASLWYQHASAFVKHAARDIGANPDIRCLFFRLCNLTEIPILPLFVFDGRQRPKVKRGSKKGKSGSHNLTQKMKEMLDVFGMEWRMALGEAEAELAYLNRVGIIDAIMTDDADAFLFGARTIIRNPSLQLTGNRSDPAVNMDGKASKHHVKIFSADAIRTHPTVRLTRGGMILIALLSGGDYNHGVKNCGPQIAHGLALCGFGDQLLNAYEHGEAHFRAFLPRWRAEVNQELHTNSQGRFDARHPGLTLPNAFPDPAVMEAYANPVCSGHNGQDAGGSMRDRGDLSLSQAASFCEAHFDEWGHQSAIIKRFRDLLFDSAVMNVLRRAALEADEKERSRPIAQGSQDLHVQGLLTPTVEQAVGTATSLVNKYLNPAVVDAYADIFVNRGRQPATLTNMADPHPLFKEIVGTRTHVSTDRMLEYRVVVNPRQLVELVKKGVKGKHPEPRNIPDITGEGGTHRTPKKSPPDPYSEMRMWLPACMIRQVHPRLVEEYEDRQQAKQAKKAGGGPSRRRAASANSNDDEGVDIIPSSSQLQEPRPSGSQPSNSQPVPHRAHQIPATQGTSATAISISNNQARPSHQPPTTLRTRTFRNVGFIDSELPPSDRTFLFTYTNPDDPDMLASDGDEINSEALPSLVITNTNIPEGHRTASAPNRKGKQKEARPAPVDDDSDYEWEEPVFVPSRLDRYNSMFERILGFPDSQPKANPKASKVAKGTAARKRARPSTSSNREAASVNAVQKTKKRKTMQNPAQPTPYTASSSSSLVPEVPVEPPTARPRHQPAPFPDLPPLDDRAVPHRTDAGSLNETDTSREKERASRRNPRTATVRPAWETSYPSSSQDSGLGDFLAGVTIFKNLSGRSR